MPGEVLKVYLVASERAVSTALIREEKEGSRCTLFVSRILRDAESLYLPKSRLCSCGDGQEVETVIFQIPGYGCPPQ